MRKEFNIHCTNNETMPDQLIRLFHFGRSENELAKTLGVTVATIRRYKDGKEAVPAMAVKLLELLDGKTLHAASSRWHGARANGDVLELPTGHRLTLNFAELERLETYRRLYHLHSLQTDLIERLIIERDFYRQQCHAEARFGMVINQLFP